MHLCLEMSVSDISGRLATLDQIQLRLQAMHGAQLLTDEVLFAVEDIIADCANASSDDRVCQLLALSPKMAGDAAFARQLRRRYA